MTPDLNWQQIRRVMWRKGDEDMEYTQERIKAYAAMDFTKIDHLPNGEESQDAAHPKTYKIPDVEYRFVATQNVGRERKGGDYQIPLDFVAHYSKQAHELNHDFADDLLVVMIAVIRDPQKRKDILQEIGGLADGTDE